MATTKIFMKLYLNGVALDEIAGASNGDHRSAFPSKRVETNMKQWGTPGEHPTL
jgi:hypothetical protein